MPHKKTGEGKPVNAQGVELRAVRVELPPEAHKELRVEAAKHDMSMAAFVRQMIEDYLAKQKGGKSK